MPWRKLLLGLQSTFRWVDKHFVLSFKDLCTIPFGLGNWSLRSFPGSSGGKVEVYRSHVNHQEPTPWKITVSQFFKIRKFLPGPVRWNWLILFVRFFFSSFQLVIQVITKRKHWKLYLEHSWLIFFCCHTLVFVFLPSLTYSSFFFFFFFGCLPRSVITYFLWTYKRNGPYDCQLIG